MQQKKLFFIFRVEPRIPLIDSERLIYKALRDSTDSLKKI